MKLLLGYDGSAGADAALFDLTMAGLPAEGQACVVVAISPLVPQEALAMDPTGAGWLAASYAAGEDDQEAIEWTRATVQKATDFLHDHFPRWEVQVETCVAIPAQALLDKAETWKPDLIVLGSQGWTWLGGALIGSTAQKVVTHAHTAVRLGKARPSGRPTAPRILIGMDGSKDAEAAVSAVEARRWPAGTQVLLLASIDFRIELSEAMAGLPQGPHPKGPTRTKQGRTWPWMEKNLAAAAANLAAKGLTVHTRILEGDPRQILLRAAHEFPADCIFLGRRGLSGFSRLMMGSVSANVAAHAACSIEIIIGK